MVNSSARHRVQFSAFIISWACDLNVRFLSGLDRSAGSCPLSNSTLKIYWKTLGRRWIACKSLQTLTAAAERSNINLREFQSVSELGHQTKSLFPCLAVFHRCAGNSTRVHSWENHTSLSPEMLHLVLWQRQNRNVYKVTITGTVSLPSVHFPFCFSPHFSQGTILCFLLLAQNSSGCSIQISLGLPVPASHHLSTAITSARSQSKAFSRLFLLSKGQINLN